MASSKFLQELNTSQREAVEYLDGPMLVLAGAGSGKTRVLISKLGYLIDIGFAQPHEILAVTFTNKAANEMKQRVEKLLKRGLDGLWIGTFHSICARILRIEARHLGYTSDFTIYDVDDQIRLIQQLMVGMNMDTSVLKPRQVQYVISQSKNKLLGPKEFEERAGDFTERKIAQIYWEYEVAMRRNNAFDFDDLLIKPLEIFTQYPEILEKYQNKFKYVLVDEYQDTNRAQYYFIKYLSATHRHVCVVGDEDQSIYRWRGADIDNILNFEKDYPECKIVRLEQNYRSTKIILDAANAVVANNTRRLGKTLWSENKHGAQIEVYSTADENAEAHQVTEIIHNEVQQKGRNYNEIAVLYRTNAQSRALEDRFRRKNIPYIIVGGTKFYERKEIKDVLAYLRVLVNPRDSVALRRIINFPTRGIGPATLQKLEDYAFLHKVGLYQALLEVNENEAIPLSIKNKIIEFIETLEDLREKLTQLSAYEIAREVVDTFRLSAQYSHSDLLEDQARLENINELLNSIAEFSERNSGPEATLQKYLEDVSLITDIDRWDPSFSAVTLMTLHSAKGLEFPVVIITGNEDGLFPLFRSLSNDEELEEERRLFYVGMTRAKENLYLLWARQRRRFSGENSGMSFRNTPSRFLLEIPADFKSEFTDTSNELEYSYDQSYSQQRQRMDDYVVDMVEESQYKIGNWVKHPTFGKGQILAVNRSRTGTKLTVVFENKQIKKLIAEYANLELL
ncbi:MAG: hypothetical protein D6748_06385 [Calditrichaeota bacterium]|nr:MAG: hypothetical protein D6748_06385 [Calditrichota bacterium]